MHYVTHFHPVAKQGVGADIKRIVDVEAEGFDLFQTSRFPTTRLKFERSQLREDSLVSAFERLFQPLGRRGRQRTGGQLLRT